MKNLKHSLQSNCHFYALGVLLSLLTLNHAFYALLGVAYIFVLRKNKHIFAIIIVMFLSALYQYTYTRIHVNPTNRFVILYIDENRITAYSNSRKYHILTREEVEIGDVFYIDQHISMYEYDQFEGDFNLNAYYKSKGIYGYFKYPEMKKIGKYNLPHDVIYKINRYIDKLPNHTSDFVKSLVIGNYDFQEKQSIGHLGLSHLFVLSGLHVAMMIGVLDKILKPLSQKKKLAFYYIFLSMYLFLTSMPISLLRAISQFLIYETLKIKHLNFTRLDALSLSFMMIFLFNPYMVYQLGFILSFIISLFFVLEAPEKGFLGLVKHTIFVQLLILPFISNFQPKFYPISFVVSPIFMLIFTYVIMPISWLSLIRPLASLFDNGFYIIKEVIVWLERGQMGINLPIFGSAYLVVYIGIWLYGYLSYLKDKRILKFLWLFCFILVLPTFYLGELDTNVTFLDVGQGDSTLIVTQHQECVILIDAFGDVYDYLRAKQITRIDYLIITHGDLDHYKEMEKVLMWLKVENLVTNPYETGDFYEIIRFKHPHSKVKSGDLIKCGNLSLNILGPIRSYGNPNNNSIVIKTIINNQTYLFAGDIEQEAEFDLVTKYKKALKSDFLKVPHHGSNTSSTKLFLEYVDPNVAIISSGRENRFKHPHQNVLDRYHLMGINVYQTKLDYTITISSSHLRRKYHILLHKQKLL